MEWRGPAWLIFVLVGFVTVLVELGTGYPAPLIMFSAGCFIFVGIVFAVTDASVRGIRRHAKRHFRAGWHKLIEVTKPLPERDWFNIDQALWALNGEQGMPQPFGIPIATNVALDEGDDEIDSPHLPTTFQTSLADLIRSNASRQSLQYLTLAAKGDRPFRIATNAMFLLRTTGERAEAFAASLRNGRLAIAAKTEDAAYRAIQFIELRSQQNSVYRGHMLRCKTARKRGFRIEFVDTPAIAREQLILPPQTLEVLERNVLQVIQQSPELRRSRRNLQHGVLLYGPPGTGKSLAIRYLITASKPTTVITVTGRQLRLIRESCQLARLLAPSLVVLEDIDLVATDRAQSRRTMLLHDLLDEMDVTSTELPIVFLMTTNRPEVIEQALSLRPGRINQAIHFPLPDDECRLRLLQHFFQGVDATAVDWTAMVTRSSGASAAFIEEWVRRSTLFAIGRQTAGPKEVRITMEDVDAAIHEIVELGGTLTRKLLGHSNEK